MKAFVLAVAASLLLGANARVHGRPHHERALAAPSVVNTASTPASTANATLGGGSQWCMTYSPYTELGGCKGASDVANDIANIAKKGFTSVRVYSTDCSGLQNIGAACKANNIKMVAGVFIDNKGIGAAAEQVQALVSWAQWELVELVVVGNEAIFNGYCSASQLADFIRSTKTKLQAAGYTGPCTTTEQSVDSIRENSAALCPVLDVVAANIHPFFNGGVSASGAGDFINSEMAQLATCCPGKQVLNLETGWPSSGASNGAAVASSSAQAQAIASIKSSCGGKVAFFSFVNDMWKADPREQSFGCGQLF